MARTDASFVSWLRSLLDFKSAGYAVRRYGSSISLPAPCAFPQRLDPTRKRGEQGFGAMHCIDGDLTVDGALTLEAHMVFVAGNLRARSLAHACRALMVAGSMHIDELLVCTSHTQTRVVGELQVPNLLLGGSLYTNAEPRARVAFDAGDLRVDANAVIDRRSASTDALTIVPDTEMIATDFTANVQRKDSFTGAMELDTSPDYTKIMDGLLEGRSPLRA